MVDFNVFNITPDMISANKTAAIIVNLVCSVKFMPIIMGHVKAVGIVNIAIIPAVNKINMIFIIVSLNMLSVSYSIKKHFATMTLKTKAFTC